MTATSDQLDALLDVERTALLQGDLERVAALMAEKESLVNELEASKSAQDALASLRNKVSRNHALFDSALAGIRAVVARIGSVQTVNKQLDTYDATGRRHSIGAHSEKALEKRA